MAEPPVGAADVAVELVADGRYPDVLLGMLRRARDRVWASVFIVDVDPFPAPRLAVVGVLRELAAARWRGLDVRLLVGGSRTNLEIAEAAAGAVQVATTLGVPARWLTARDTRASHVKLVLCDDEILTGSHNWSPGAFSGLQTQDSARLVSADLAAHLAGTFLAQWARAGDGRPRS